jgi:peptide/nickel transport system substrate-binding protein
MATGKIDFFRASWIADYPDPENYMLLFYEPNWPPNGPNYSRFNSIAFNELYEHLRSVVNGQQRDSLLKKMNNELELQNPIIPLFYDQVIRLSLLRVHHLPLHPLNLLDVRNVSLNP